MKICLLNNTFMPFSRGGAETVVKTTALELIKNGYGVFVITTRPFFSKEARGNKKNKNTFKIYYLKSFFYFYLKLPRIVRLIWHLFGLINPISYLRIKRILKKEKPDVIILNNLIGMGFLIPGLVKKLNIKYLQILHDIQFLHPSGLLIKNDEKLIDTSAARAYQYLTKNLLKPDVVISPSAWLLELYLSRGFFENSKKGVLPNPAVFQAGEGVKLNNGFFSFLFVGKLAEHKGAPFLIKAFNDFINDGNIRLLIVGPGRLSREMEKLAKQNKNIKLLGSQSSSRVAEIMRKSSCLILPSLCYENSPTVIYEAAAAGLPVMGSDLGGTPELINDLGGILFQAGDMRDLVLKMNWAIKNPRDLELMAEEAKQKIKKFSAENYVKTLKKFF